MQTRQDHLDPRHVLLGVEIDRHTAPIVGDFEGTVLVQGDVETPGVAGNRFVHAVVDDLLGQVIGATRIGKHAGTLAHRFQTT